MEWELSSPFSHLPQRLVSGIQGFGCRAPLVIPPLIEPSGHRPLKAVDLGFQSGVPGDLPTSPQPVFQAYFILNTGRDLRAWVSNRATLRSGSFHSPKNGAGEVLNTRVDIHTIMQFRVERNFGFQEGLEFGSVSAPDIRCVLEG